MTKRGPEPQAPVVPHLALWWVVAVAIVLGVIAGGLQHPLWATGILSVACCVGAVLRAVMPQSRAGGLVVRSRWFDVTLLTLLGLAVGIIGRAMNLHPHL